MNALLALLLIFSSAKPAPKAMDPIPPVTPSLPGFKCTPGHRSAEGLEMSIMRCSDAGGVMLDAMHSLALNTRSPSVTDVCKADLNRVYGMAFEHIKAARAIGVVGEHPACRAEISGTHRGDLRPWQMVDITIALDDTHWMTLTAQGPIELMQQNQTLVERFLADTTPK